MSLVGRPAQNHPQQVRTRGALDKVDDRRTPDSLFIPLHAEFGFTLDAAASAENAKVSKFYTIENSGLINPWARETVWCNPPYSNIGEWVEKADFEAGWVGAAWEGTKIVMLLPANRTEQGWWQDFIELGRRSGRIETRFLRGRLRFDTPEGTYSDPRGNRPPFGCVLVIWGNR